MKDIEAELLYGRVYQMGKAIRFAMVMIVVTICIVPLMTITFLAPGMRMMLSEMGDAELPIISQLIFQGKYFFIGFSGLLPLLAIATMAMKNLTASFYLLGVIAVVASIYAAIILMACFLPLFQILNIMGAQ